ncbi:MAG: hypothetical protein ACOYXC_04250, partial [Candidatus Rifleibacteriota bacterium]
MSGSWLDMLFACQDLILVFSGILWFVVAVSASCAETENRRSLKPLAQFFFCQSLIDWLKMVSISFDFNHWLLFGYSTFLAISFFLLLKISFSDEEERISRFAEVSIDFGIGIVIVFSIICSFGRLNFELLNLFLALSVPISLLFLVKFRKLNFLIAAGICLVAVTAVINTISWPMILARLLLAAIFSFFLVRICCSTKSFEGSKVLLKDSPYLISVPVVLGLCAVFGLSALAEREIRENILLKAETIATALD